MSCSATDVSSILPFETALRDEYFGYEMLVATKTDVMCQNMTASISKQLVMETNRPQYSFVVRPHVRLWLLRWPGCIEDLSKLLARSASGS